MVPFRKKHPMHESAVEGVELVSGWADGLEDLLSKQTGLSRKEARQLLASRERIPANTIANLINYRTRGIKSVTERVYNKLRTAFIREFKAEIARLEHSITLAEQSGRCLPPHEIAAAEALVAKARRLAGESS